MPTLPTEIIPIADFVVYLFEQYRIHSSETLVDFESIYSQAA